MMEWYYILGAISYGIFLVQFLLSNLGVVDFDLDVDFDAEPDLTVGDLVSFKGLIHFCMGFSGWLMLCESDGTWSVVTAVAVGFVFVIVLAFVYAFCAALQYEPAKPTGEQLVGKAVAIYAHLGGAVYTAYLNCPVYTEIKCISQEPLKVGDVRTIESYKLGIYYLS